MFLCNPQGRVEGQAVGKTLFQSTELFEVNRMPLAVSLRYFSHQCSTCFKKLAVVNSTAV